jgi:GNAT superfamily N-acetyltransferase
MDFPAPHQLTPDEFVAALNPNGRRLSDRTVYSTCDLEGMDAGAQRTGYAKLRDGTLLSLRETDTAVFGRIGNYVAGFAGIIASRDTEIVVASEHAGKGVATALYRRFLERAPYYSSGGFTAGGEAVARAVHRQFVEEAVRAGEPVPERVLRCYTPDSRARQPARR